jgi:hypothetical protein
LFPRSVDDAPETGKVVRFRAPSQAPAPLPDFFGHAEGPLVYLTFGTVVGSMDGLQTCYRVALEGVRTLPARVLLTIGKELPLESLGKMSGASGRVVNGGAYESDRSGRGLLSKTFRTVRSRVSTLYGLGRKTSKVARAVGVRSCWFSDR